MPAHKSGFGNSLLASNITRLAGADRNQIPAAAEGFGARQNVGSHPPAAMGFGDDHTEVGIGFLGSADTALAGGDELAFFPQDKDPVVLHHRPNITFEILEAGFDALGVHGLRSIGGDVVVEYFGEVLVGGLKKGPLPFLWKGNLGFLMIVKEQSVGPKVGSRIKA